MIVGYVGLGMGIEMRLCTIMRAIIMSFYEYKPLHFARFATLSCHPNHPCTAFFLTIVLPCGEDSPRSPDFRRISSPVISSSPGKVTPKRQNWPVTYTGVCYNTHPTRISVQKTIVLYTKHGGQDPISPEEAGYIGWRAVASSGQ